MGEENEATQFAKGVTHFNAGQFFEAHEVWEELWLRAPTEEKPFLQGIIQIAAAFHHFKRGNVSGAKSLLAAGLEKTSPYSDKHRGIDVEQLRRQGHAWLQAFETGAAPVAADLPQIRRAALKSESPTKARPS